jgi:hypothetical protein
MFNEGTGVYPYIKHGHPTTKGRNMATKYTHKSGYLIKVEVFSCHTELTFINPKKTEEEYDHYSNVIEVKQKGNWLHWVAVDRSSGMRQAYKAELLVDSRPTLDLMQPNLAELRAMFKAEEL